METRQMLQGEPLRVLAERIGIKFGAAAHYDSMVIEPETYKEIIKREFMVLTAGNDLKWSSVHKGERHRYDFMKADYMVKFAEDNGLEFHGHTLVWFNHNPEWSDILPVKEIESVMYDHIDTVVGRYKGRVKYWDVVNEAYDQDGELRPCLWTEAMGEDYIKKAFIRAHQVDPDAVLIYNEGWGFHRNDAQFAAVYQMAKKLLGEGVPIHGIGFQCHAKIGDDMEKLYGFMKQISDLGLDVHVTECDVRLTENPSIADYEAQAAIYKGILEAFLGIPNQGVFQIWHFTDRSGWNPQWHPRIFDMDYSPKPAYYALQEALRVHNVRLQL
jgi:endo-1,4-beta-xylanase